MIAISVLAIFFSPMTWAKNSQNLITAEAREIRADVSGEKLILKAKGQNVATHDCFLSKPGDNEAFNDFVQELGKAGPVTIDLKGLEQYCEIRKLEHRCLYDKTREGCSSDEIARVSGAVRDGYDLIDVREDLKRFIFGSSSDENRPATPRDGPQN